MPSPIRIVSNLHIQQQNERIHQNKIHQRTAPDAGNRQAQTPRYFIGLYEGCRFNSGFIQQKVPLGFLHDFHEIRKLRPQLRTQLLRF